MDLASVEGLEGLSIGGLARRLSMSKSGVIGHFESKQHLQLETIRETGLAYDDAELFTEVRCAAVPVIDFKGDIIGAIGISGPVWRLSLTALQGKLPMLRQAAERACSELGGRVQ